MSKKIQIVHIVKIVKFVNMVFRSCFLITLIKCHKGHNSLELLFNVKNQTLPEAQRTQGVESIT